MYTPRTLAAFMALAAAALATTGPCIINDSDYTCGPVMDASACYNAIILGWDGASKNPADIFKCVDPPELVSLLFFHRRFPNWGLFRGRNIRGKIGRPCRY